MDKVQYARAIASRHLDSILRLFKPGAKITLIVRRDGEPEQDFLLTDDDLDEVSTALDRAKGRPDAG